MNRIIALSALAVSLAACQPAGAHDYKLGDLEISHPWSRPAAQGMNGAGYLTVVNTGRAPDRLRAVESPAATRVEIHETSMTGGVMRMRQLADGYAIGSGERLELKPGGGHLMLIGLKRPLKAGEKVPATLVFDRAGRITVELAVQTGAPDEHEHAGH